MNFYKSIIINVNNIVVFGKFTKNVNAETNINVGLLHKNYYILQKTLPDR